MSKVKIDEVLMFQPSPEMLDRFDNGIEFRPSHARRPWAMLRFVELKKFLVLLAILQERDSNQRCSPPQEVDMMWHHFISDDTRAYTDFCNTYLGGYIHHQAGGNYPKENLVALAIELRIQLDPRFWAPPRFGVQCG
ncbi:MAG: hypothetical protein A2821_03685 [Candidatus Magasanikbacteria bacterium RIFCSPHIGHO2_01_FULL_41_23]|uniref:Uncharacterized protein n=1 Tax=Candidatus Magasanikbacteria bacterium RIFCSPLOWO2_01_FULL_40_15 TaxID=1798686 RepID=A0A1F6N467_9BACT|nr:MAG: hypothetical protein A2821_03685 [Candidatus Magasanikbacteria bacterium RIFCSPHIGHO2_01_FULL_41_23]OGH66604.1 MAG: hypothetical protein A3C66_03045 [Candidatus Magasanikbacteria bacterium RIFCSPHIGHO2_02_FULL_41_35]OGH76638.1 MAG: hypothetical protein A3F22_01525 [Candidatus Magasanikbacteria bacterium RIFCSPHIGHO2_12_FULL_41_16]OGH78795.1 MAG: hypothetical protein A2983_00430 [Candidatus Magasanikbacteria bacterium RIFCSPLOWO2_01_FULL_40_15]